MTISRYTADDAAAWDDFVQESKNGTFLFMRGYMDYHSDRFTDHSLMFRDDKGRILAVMPANQTGNELWSHQGLTYGGMVISKQMHSPDVGSAFSLLFEYMKRNGLARLHYKPVPTIYHLMPAEEDEYWLWRNNAQMEACNLSATINLQSDMICNSKRKQSYARQLASKGYTINRNTPLSEFWPLLTENLLTTYNAKPVHSLEEIQRLQSLFPESIQCWSVVSAEGKTLCGIVLYFSNGVVHTQYISASADGKQCHALDYLFINSVEHLRKAGIYKYFDFGTSNENNGRILNESLITQKEQFGGRGITYKMYVINI